MLSSICFEIIKPPLSANIKISSLLAGSRLRLGRIYLLLVFLAELGGSVLAAVSDSNWSLRSWQVDNGLPDNTVTGVAQTSEGYMWVATHGGLVRFDGVRFTPWPLPIASDPLNPLIRTMMLGLENRLWLALETEGGLLIGLSDHATNIFNATSGVHNSRPVVIVETPEGTKWVSYADGSVGRFADGKVKLLGPREGLAGTGLCWLTVDPKGNLWFAKARHVGLFEDGHFKTTFALNEETIRIAPARDGGIWILAGQHLLKCSDGKTMVSVGDLPTSRAGVAPSVVYEDMNGGLWLGTMAGGLFHWDGKVIVPVETSHHDISSITEDREGNIWVGTEGGGLNRLRNRILELHGASESISFESARSVCEDDAGVVWATGANGALVRLVAGEWMPVTNGVGWTGARASCVASDHQGGVWIGTYRGGYLYHWRNGEFALIGRKDGVGGDAVRALFVDSRNDLWIGFETPDLLQRLHDGQFQTFALAVGNRTVRSIVEDAAGKIWVGTQGGVLLRVENDRLVDETAHALQPTKAIRALHATPDGSLWIGYAGAGVGWLQKGKFSSFGVEQGLPDNNICGIESDHNGALWFTGSHGIFQVQPVEFTGVAGRLDNRLLALEFGRNEGLQNLQGSYGFWPNTVRGHDGRLWFATRSGLVTAWPNRLQPNLTPPEVLIERFLVDGQPQNAPPAGRPMRLPPAHRNIEVQFTALNFTAPENILLQHRLEGWDENWSDPGPARSFTYSRLPAGRYVFHVRARNAAGVWNHEGAKLDFVIDPFFWQRWWFRLLVLALVAGLAWLAYFVRMARLRQLERLRLQIARDLHDDVGANLASIALITEAMQKRPPFGNPADVRRIALQTIDALRDIVWFIDPARDNLGDLVSRMRDIVPTLLTGIKYDFQTIVPNPSLHLPPAFRRNVFPIFKETLHNAVRHAQANRVEIQLDCRHGGLRLKIHDDGKGFDEYRITPGNGLRNLRRRAAEMHGSVEIRSAPGQGTTVEFYAPFPQTRGLGFGAQPVSSENLARHNDHPEHESRDAKS